MKIKQPKPNLTVGDLKKRIAELKYNNSALKKDMELAMDREDDIAPMLKATQGNNDRIKKYDSAIKRALMNQSKTKK